MLCFTGFVPKNQKILLEEKFKSFVVLFWNLKNTDIRDKQYQSIIEKCFNIISLDKPLITNTMRRIITSQKQIDDLRKELKLMQHDAEKNEISIR